MPKNGEEMADKISFHGGEAQGFYEPMSRALVKLKRWYSKQWDVMGA